MQEIGVRDQSEAQGDGTLAVSAFRSLAPRSPEVQPATSAAGRCSQQRAAGRCSQRKAASGKQPAGAAGVRPTACSQRKAASDLQAVAGATDRSSRHADSGGQPATYSQRPAGSSVQPGTCSPRRAASTVREFHDGLATRSRTIAPFRPPCGQRRAAGGAQPAGAAGDVQSATAASDLQRAEYSLRRAASGGQPATCSQHRAARSKAARLGLHCLQGTLALARIGSG